MISGVCSEFHLIVQLSNCSWHHFQPHQAAVFREKALKTGCTLPTQHPTGAQQSLVLKVWGTCCFCRGDDDCYYTCIIIIILLFFLSHSPCSSLLVSQWVVVTHVVNPSHFYVRYVAEKRERENLSKKIYHLCSRDSSHFSSSDTVETGVWLEKWGESYFSQFLLNICFLPKDWFSIQTFSIRLK